MKILVTGGCGLIGFHTAKFYKEQGHQVDVIDNLERSSLLGYHLVSKERKNYNKNRLNEMGITVLPYDVSLKKSWNFTDAHDAIIHLAAQCSVPTSISNPRRDYEVNLQGTFNALEQARQTGAKFVFASTNKVYPIHDAFVHKENRWHFTNPSWALRGFPVVNDLVGSRTPYGWSKYSADLLCQEYYHTYGVQTGVFRMSCLHQDQSVQTYFGTKLIKNLTKDDLLWTGSNWTKVKKVWNNGVKETYKIQTEQGRTVLLTEDHKVKTVRGFRQVKDLMFGDLIEVSPQTNIPVDSSVSKEDLYKAELLGYLFGDGTLYKVKNKPNSYIISFYGTKAALNNIKDILNYLKINSGEIKSSYSKSEICEGTSYKLHFSSSYFGNLLVAMGMPIGDRTTQPIDIPFWIQNGSKNIKRAFLRGYFGAECCASKNKDTCITFSYSKDVSVESDKWLGSIRHILYKDFDIETSISTMPPKKWKTRTTIQTQVRVIGGIEGRKNFNNIGFAFEENRNRNLLSRLNLIEYENRYFDKIKSIEFFETSTVYDLEVEDSSHVFTAGDILVSNCIYGPNQFGFEEQGWATYFVIATERGWPITIFGDGDQVRDMLYVEDLVRAYDAFITSDLEHGVFNTGGGLENTLSLNECIYLLSRISGKKSEIKFEDWRPSDQKTYISDLTEITRKLDWHPRVNPIEGLRNVHDWVKNNLEVF